MSIWDSLENIISLYIEFRKEDNLTLLNILLERVSPCSISSTKVNFKEINFKNLYLLPKICIYKQSSIINILQSLIEPLLV